MGYSEALEQQVKMIGAYTDTNSSLAMRLVQEFQAGKRQGRIANDMQIEEFAGNTLGWIQRAEPYYWSPAICQIIESTAGTMPEWTLLEEALPSRAGFFYFAKPLPLPGHETRDDPLVGIGWTRYTETPTQKKLIAISFLVQQQGERVPWPESGMPWTFGEGWQACIESAASSRGLDIPERMRCQARYLAACMAFLNQRILVSPGRRAERHAVKRLERDGWTHEPLIRVVELRRRAHHSYQFRNADPAMIAWTHQWVVSGHWREQPYPSKNITQPIWIMPYVKGPEDKPLKAPRAKVFAVVR